MKLDRDTAIIIAKCLCFVTIGFFTPLTVGLAQWANTGEWPGKIIWVVTGASCFVGAASQLLSFLSGSYSDYVASRPTPDTSPLAKPETPAPKP